MDTGERPGPQPPKPPGRRPLPATLPRQRVEIDGAEADQVCACGTAKAPIGEMVSEKLDFVPALVRVIETVRPKYADAHGRSAGGRGFYRPELHVRMSEQ